MLVEPTVCSYGSRETAVGGRIVARGHDSKNSHELCEKPGSSPTNTNSLILFAFRLLRCVAIRNVLTLSRAISRFLLFKRIWWLRLNTRNDCVHFPFKSTLESSKKKCTNKHKKKSVHKTSHTTINFFYLLAWER